MSGREEKPPASGKKLSIDRADQTANGSYVAGEGLKANISHVPDSDEKVDGGHDANGRGSDIGIDNDAACDDDDSEQLEDNNYDQFLRDWYKEQTDGADIGDCDDGDGIGDCEDGDGIGVCDDGDGENDEDQLGDTLHPDVMPAASSVKPSAVDTENHRTLGAHEGGPTHGLAGQEDDNKVDTKKKDAGDQGPGGVHSLVDTKRKEVDAKKRARLQQDKGENERGLEGEIDERHGSDGREGTGSSTGGRGGEEDKDDKEKDGGQSTSEDEGHGGSDDGTDNEEDGEEETRRKGW